MWQFLWFWIVAPPNNAHKMIRSYLSSYMWIVECLHCCNSRQSRIGHEIWFVFSRKKEREKKIDGDAGQNAPVLAVHIHKIPAPYIHHNCVHWVPMPEVIMINNSNSFVYFIIFHVSGWVIIIVPFAIPISRSMPVVWQYCHSTPTIICYNMCPCCSSIP